MPEQQDEKSIAEIELQRERWRRARVSRKMDDVAESDFATGGLGGRVEDLSMRVLVLPQDPARGYVKFNEDRWRWWEHRRGDPFRGQSTSFGSTHAAAADAVISFDQHYQSSEPNVWLQYIALTRGGELDVELSRTTAVGLNGGALSSCSTWWGACGPAWCGTPR